MTTTPPTSNPSPGEPVPVDAAIVPHKRTFVRAAVVVSALTFLSRITGLARDVYLAAAFGLGPISDAFWFGFAMPNLFRRLFGEGALTAAFIPVYTDLMHTDKALARRFASLCLTLTTVVLISLTLLGEIGLYFALYWQDWSIDTALAIRLTMLMLPYMPAVCLVAIIGAMLQVHGRFAPAAGMPIFLNVVMIIGTWYAMGPEHNDETLVKASLIVGGSVVIAGIVQVLAQGALLVQYESFTRHFHGTRESFKAMMTTLLPMLVALSVFQINTFIDGLIAFFFSPKTGGPDRLEFLGKIYDYPIDQGGFAALQWAQRLYQFPLGVFGIAIATAIFPALAHAAAGGDAGKNEFRTTLQHGLRLTVFIGLPASAGLMLVGLPVSRALYEHGKFRLEDAQRIATILYAYAPAIWAYSMTHVITRAFYAKKDAQTPLKISVWMVVLNVSLNFTLVWPMGAAGLALSTAISAIVQNILMLIIVRRHINNPVDKTVWKAWGRIALYTLAMSAAVIAVGLCFDDPAKLSKKMVYVQVTAMVLTGAGVYFAAAWLSKAEEITWLRRRRKPAESGAL